MELFSIRIQRTFQLVSTRYRFVKFCELFRKGFCVEDDEEQLMPDSHSSENDETKDETEVENEM